MIRAQLGWLQGPRTWSDGGQIAWDGKVPTTQDFAQVPHLLRRLKSYPIAARHVLGDPEVFVESVRGQWELAKTLATFQASNTAPENLIANLILGLLAESLCENLIDNAPSQTIKTILDKGGKEAEIIRMALRAARTNQENSLLLREMAGCLLESPPPRHFPLPLWAALEENLPDFSPLLEIGITHAWLWKRVCEAGNTSEIRSLAACAKQHLVPLWETLRETPHHLPTEHLARGTEDVTQAVVRHHRQKRQTFREAFGSWIGKTLMASESPIDDLKVACELATTLLALPAPLRSRTALLKEFFLSRSLPDWEVLTPYISLIWCVTPLEVTRGRHRKDNLLLYWECVEERYKESFQQCYRLANACLKIQKRLKSKEYIMFLLKSGWLLHFDENYSSHYLPCELYDHLVKLLQRYPYVYLLNCINWGKWGVVSLSLLEPLLAFSVTIPKEMQDDSCQVYFLNSVLDAWNDRNKPIAIEPFIPLFYRMFCYYQEKGGDRNWHSFWLQAILQWAEHDPLQALALGERVFQEYTKKRNAQLHNNSEEAEEEEIYYWGIQSWLPLFFSLSEGNVETYLALINTHPNESASDVEKTIRLLDELPTVRIFLKSCLLKHPQRCLKYLQALGNWQVACDFGHSSLATWKVTQFHMADASAQWQTILNYVLEQASLIATLWYADWLCGGDGKVPPSLAHALAIPEKLQTQIAYLQTRPEMSARVKALQAQLTDTEKIHQRIRREIGDCLPDIARERQLSALERLERDLAWAVLETRYPNQATHTVPDADMRNALHLRLALKDPGTNAPLLRRLLRACWRGEGRAFVTNHPRNQQFYTELRAAGGNPTAWLSRNEQEVTLSNGQVVLSNGQVVRIWLETNPLRVLQMGNLFNTCLSVDGCNAFSAVTNACEQNKRVLWVADANGKIIARKLIAINNQWEIVGFHFYYHGDTTTQTLLSQVVDTYVQTFAERCRLNLGTQGEVPRLFATDWYNDGITQWSTAPNSGRDISKEKALPRSEC
jgi:hypothetical protein